MCVWVCVCVCVFECVYVCVKRSALYVSNVHTCEHSLHAVPPVCNDIHQFVTYFTCICDLVVEVPLMQAVPACSGIEYLSHPTQFSRWPGPLSNLLSDAMHTFRWKSQRHIVVILQWNYAIVICTCACAIIALVSCSYLHERWLCNRSPWHTCTHNIHMEYRNTYIHYMHTLLHMHTCIYGFVKWDSAGPTKWAQARECPNDSIAIHPFTIRHGFRNIHTLRVRCMCTCQCAPIADRKLQRARVDPRTWLPVSNDP